MDIAALQERIAEASGFTENEQMDISGKEKDADPLCNHLYIFGKC